MHRFSNPFIAAILTGAALVIAAPLPGLSAEQRRLEDYVAAVEPPSFATPGEAVAAFKDVLRTNDLGKLAALLGIDAAKLRESQGAAETFALIREGAERRFAEEEADGAHYVVLGDRLWPMPFPVTKRRDGKWAFDTFAGLAEIAARRIGENELETVETMKNYVLAQQEYVQADHDGDGVLEYARKLISDPGTRDGLFWSPDDAEVADASPGGAALLQAAWDKAKAGEGYFGYHYRILTGQGEKVAGGRYDYVINGNMIAGFGLVAWPVEYGRTGVHTFVVDKDGIVYQADLGRDTAKLASDIRRFNPDDKWEIAAP